jgi:hypothetical protein
MQVDRSPEAASTGAGPALRGSERHRIFEADQALVAHPDFGLTAAIAGRALERYRFELELLAGQAPALNRVVTAVADPQVGSRVFTDPLVRILMNESFDHFTQGSFDSARALELGGVLTGALECAANDLGYMESRLTRRHRVGPPCGAWLWSFERSEDACVLKLQDHYRRIVLDELQADSWTVGVPDEETARHLSSASALLTALLPASGPSALQFISAVSIISATGPWGATMSGSGGDLLPSTIFLAPDNLANPWDTSNHMFHEGLHLKLFDVARVFAFTKPGVPKLEIPWRREMWTVVRVVYSLHVYAHLLVYSAALKELGPSLHDTFGDPASYPAAVHPLSGINRDEESTYGNALSRARYFVQQLRGPWSVYLTPDGRRFVDWLCAIAQPFGLTSEEQS